MPDDMAPRAVDAAGPLTVVLFSASYPPRVGGLETAVARLARELQGSGYRVAVVTNRYPRALPRREQIDGVPVHRLLFPAPFVPPSAWRRIHLGMAALLLPLAPLALLRLWLLLRRLRPDVVNVHYVSAPSLYVAALSSLRLLRARLVVSCHGSDLAAPYPTGSRAASRWVLSRADAVTACSADLLRHAARVAPRPPGQVRMVVYNGVDPDEFAGVAPRAHPRPYILGVGRLVEEKGMHLLVEALALLRARGLDCDLVIVGIGPEEGRLRRLAADLGVASHVSLAGAVGRAELGALYRGCAVFALASLREGFGLVALEAMACGRPVVAARIGGLPEVVADGETGLLARVGDPADLAEKLAALLADPARAAEMGRRGRARATAEFAWPAVAARYMAAYRPAFAGEDAGAPSAGDSSARRPSPPTQRFARTSPSAAPTVWPSPPDAGEGSRPSPIAHRPSLTRRARATGGGGVPILMYHQVAPPTPGGVGRSLLVTPRAFAAQMRLLHRLGWRTLRLTELAGLLNTAPALPRRRFVLTFDDAFRGVLDHAAPVLAELGFVATVFVPTALVGTCRALDGGPDHADKRLMGWDDLRAWRAQGHDVGAHARTHPHLPLLRHGALMDEVAGARADLAAALGEPPATFAYPYGEWTPPVAAAVRDAGYAAACTTHFGRTTPTSDRFALPRISVGADLDLPHFAYRLARADHIARRTADRHMPGEAGG